MLLKSKGTANSVYDHASYLPTFGNGHCLYLGGGSQSYTNIANATDYEIPIDGSGAFGLSGGQNTWTDSVVEIYSVVPKVNGRRNAEAIHLNFRWLASEKESLLRLVRGYTPVQSPDFQLQFINVLIFGGVGAGKSSFLNSVESVLRNRLAMVSIAGEGVSSVTTKVLKFQMSGTRICLWDCPGWTVRDYRTGELGYLLDGHLPHNFDFKETVTRRSPGFVEMPTFADQVHCFVMAIPVGCVSSREYTDRITELNNFARPRGIITLILLTKIDKYDAKLQNSGLAALNDDDDIGEIIKDLSEATGIIPNYILPVKNYNSERECQLHTDILLLSCLKRMTEAVDDLIIARTNERFQTSSAGRTPKICQSCHQVLSPLALFCPFDGIPVVQPSRR